ncbi:cold-shock protein [Streptomyces sp. M19]
MASVSLQEIPAEPPRRAAVAASSPRLANDECDVLTSAGFTAAVTELLIEEAPTLTGAQISQVRSRLLTFADSHGWIEG